MGVRRDSIELKLETDPTVFLSDLLLSYIELQKKGPLAFFLIFVPNMDFLDPLMKENLH